MAGPIRKLVVRAVISSDVAVARLSGSTKVAIKALLAKKSVAEPVPMKNTPTKIWIGVASPVAINVVRIVIVVKDIFKDWIDPLRKGFQKVLDNPSKHGRENVYDKKKRLITKTDLAKFLNVWLGKPGMVCR